MIREAIKKIKENNNITYPQMLEKAGLPVSDDSSVAAFVRGERTYPVEKINKIFKAWGVEIVVRKEERTEYTENEKKNIAQYIEDLMPYMNIIRKEDL